MTLDEAIKKEEIIAEENQRVVDTGIVFDDVTIDMLYCDDTEVIAERLAGYQRCAKEHRQLAEWLKDYKRLLEQEPCEDAISRQAVLEKIKREEKILYTPTGMNYLIRVIKELPPINPQSKTGHCKDCKHFEYNSVTRVDGIPLILAHEICKRWGDGCKTSEDGYCFLFEPQESEGKE